MLCPDLRCSPPSGSQNQRAGVGKLSAARRMATVAVATACLGPSTFEYESCEAVRAANRRGVVARAPASPVIGPRCPGWARGKWSQMHGPRPRAWMVESCAAQAFHAITILPSR